MLFACHILKKKIMVIGGDNSKRYMMKLLRNYHNRYDIRLKKGEIMLKKIMGFFKDEEGATAVEYAIMVALIAIVIIFMVTLVGKRANSTFSKVQSALSTT